MEPLSAVTTALKIAKTAEEISKQLYEFGKGLKDREAKRQVDEILDKFRELKQSASELEDQNRELREQLRFKSDDYEFRTPFRYRKGKPDQPLCVKCFSNNIEAQMGELGHDCLSGSRRCLVCGTIVEVNQTWTPSPRISSDFPSGSR
jgi:polyhydroxyalkanoate synthesis regulator phasin